MILGLPGNRCSSRRSRRRERKLLLRLSMSECRQVNIDELCIKMMNFVLKMMDFVLKMMDFVLYRSPRKALC